MLYKIIALLIIQICLLSKFDYYIYSIQNKLFYQFAKTNNFQNNNDNDLINLNKINFSNSLFNYSNAFNVTNIVFELSNFSYIFSFRFNIIQVEYYILFSYQNGSFISPSDLSLYYDLHLICHINIVDSNLTIDSLASIYLNKFFHCIEFININEKISFGITIYKPKIGISCTNISQYFFNNSVFNYNKLFHKENKLFHPTFIRKHYYLKKKYISLNIKSLYILKPESNTKSNIIKSYNEWKFFNIYNHYFCFCVGNKCLYQNILNINNTTQICKYKFYLYLIDENKHLYNKTDYLLADFPWSYQSLDDAFPVFKKLIKLKKNAYYMTINTNIFQNTSIYNLDDNLYNHIIKSNFINGDFLEKYFSLFLKLKAVVSGAEFFSFRNLFYYIDYITFISLTHGLNYFKTELFKTYYGRSRYHKLVISTSEKLISLATQNGWEEKDLIKICLPKWDKFDLIKNKNFINKNISIFFFFTWRIWQKNITDEMKLESIYFKNIIELMNNNFLIDILDEKGIILNFCLHHMLEIYKDKLNFRNKNINIIKQNEIFKYIIKSSLLVTDFSSIIFEFMYQNKPFVMFIPDSQDPNISKYYDKDYFNLIKGLKDGSIDFMNKFFDINLAVDKIIYYINNDFQLENNLVQFYNSFNFMCGNNTLKFINYLKNIRK